MATTQIARRQLADGIIDDSKVGAGAGIATSKLALNGTIILKDGSVAFTGDQSLGGQKLTNVGTPSSSGDAANKSYVDTQITNVTGLFTSKGTVRAGTTANITLSGAQTIDGVSVIAGDRVLVKNQSAPAENGLYLAAAGAWTRSTDMDVWGEVPGAWVTIQEGTANADTTWLSTANQGGTLNTTAITWSNPITTGSLTTANFVTREVPSGAIDGSNATYTLANTPTSGSEEVFLNGQLLSVGAGADYTISTNTITMASAPLTGERILVNYRK